MAPKRKSELEEFEKSTRPFLRDEFVTVTLDGSSSSYEVSKAMLCHASPYFVKALNGSFKEGKERALRLPECDENTFKLFIGYLANNRLPDLVAEYDSFTASDKSEQAYKMADSMARAFHGRLVSLWSFADACLMPNLKNEAMRRFLDMSDLHAVRPKTIALAYNLTTGGSAMRRVVVDELVFDYMTGLYGYFDDSWFSETGAIEGFFHDFTMRLVHCKDFTCDEGCTYQPSALEDPRDYLVEES